MSVFKAMVGTDQGSMLQVDAIEFENKLWLVPHWLEAPAQGIRMPRRIIRFDNLPHQDLRGKNASFGDFVLSYGIPKALLDETISSPTIAIPFEIRELPEIRLPLPQPPKWN
jgi:hypothetical protein